MDEYRYFVPAARGLEAVVADELKALQATEVQPQIGGVAFRGSLEAGYRANLWLRSGVRVLLLLKEFQASSADKLYRQALEVPWEKYFHLHKTFAVQANIRDSALRHSHYVALKVKDAIADRFRRVFNRRPDVNTSAPDILINVYLKADHCQLYLDMSGESLHRRGYRTEKGAAPLNEALAAGMLAIAGYTGRQPFVDPMCGAGTLPIEAALIARQIAPGLLRSSFAFQHWRKYDERLWQSLLDEARHRRLLAAPAPIVGSDLQPRVLEIARANARRAGVLQDIRFEQRPLTEARPVGDHGILICNPPYGERLGVEKSLAELYKSIGDLLKQHFKGYTGFVFTGNLNLAKRIGLKPRRRHILYNGPIECRLLEFPIY
ncbi:MAG: THUMP domain-containing protein [candidate division KSB1 bacterium]|nr:THUMP domain-containing protein [candidate division KSB1 bacterium]MDQ7065726.1 THUMP domain-containing protein [candidate division KSB1 bacterium]